MSTKRPGKPENLVVPTSDKARKIGRAGGIASGEARREKKRMTQIYAEVLAKKYDVDGVELDGHELVGTIVMDILKRRDSASVSLIREIREATEGSKVAITGANGDDLFKAFADAADAKVRKTAELKEPEL